MSVGVEHSAFRCTFTCDLCQESRVHAAALNSLDAQNAAADKARAEGWTTVESGHIKPYHLCGRCRRATAWAHHEREAYRTVTPQPLLSRRPA